MLGSIQEYKSEVEDILVGDKQLAAEILFDMKQLEQEKAAATAVAATPSLPVVAYANNPPSMAPAAADLGERPPY